MATSGARRGGYTMLKGCLWLLITCSAACFVIITFMRTTDWYSTDLEFTYIRNNMTIDFPGDVPVPTTTSVKNGKTVTVLIGRDVPLWAGSSAFPVTLQWGSIMIGALAAAGLQQLARMQPASSASTPGASRLTAGSTASTLMHGMCGAMTTLSRKVRRVFSTQVPPVRFWSWFCGGLSILDTFLVFLWCGLTVTYLYYLISRKFENTAKNLTPPPAPPPVFPPPSPSPAPPGVNMTGPPPSPTARAVDLLSPLFTVRRLDNCAKAFGEVLRMNMMIMFLPISRSNFLKWLCGTDYPTLIKYHRWMSWGTIWITFVHSVLYMIEWGAEGTLDEELSWADLHGQRNVVGLIATIASLVIAFTSTAWFRANYYWLFYRTHIFCMLVFIIFSVLHYKGFISWLWPALVLYAIDRAFRYWQLATNWTSIGPEDVVIDGNMLTVQLTWAQREGQTITAGQTLYLRCPAFSLFNSHPFSVADVTHSEDGTTHVILHFVARGPWTTALQTRIQQGCRVRMQVEGPYTTTLDYVPTTPVVVMVAGGIGVTPLLALLHRYLRQHTAFLMSDNEDMTDTTTAVPKVYMVWSSRRLSELKLFGSSLLASCTPASASTSPTGSMTHTTSGYAGPAHTTDSDPKLDVRTCPMTKQPSDGTGSDGMGSASRQLSGIGKGWLHARLHYTGFELEHQQNSVEVNVATSTLGDKASSGAGAPPPRHLAAHPASTPYLYALCILFGFFGAWAGLLATQYYDGYRSRTTAAGPDYLTSATLQCVFITAGGIFPPMAVLAVHWAVVRCVRARRNASTPEEIVGASVLSPSASKGHLLGSFLRNTLVVLPGYILAPSKTFGAADGLTLGRGRPDLQSVLEEVLRAHPELPEIEVLVAGGDSLVVPVLSMCAKHNCSREKGPALLVKRVAHHN